MLLLGVKRTSSCGPLLRNMRLLRNVGKYFGPHCNMYYKTIRQQHTNRGNVGRSSPWIIMSFVLCSD